ncbi:hypothetical protein RJ55_05803 [Drechmeria coniospora]|nr:hypothetical protein RJ55_05803 [Drechmeria coniospora]
MPGNHDIVAYVNVHIHHTSYPRPIGPRRAFPVNLNQPLNRHDLGVAAPTVWLFASASTCHRLTFVAQLPA